MLGGLAVHSHCAFVSLTRLSGRCAGVVSRCGCICCCARNWSLVLVLVFVVDGVFVVSWVRCRHGSCDVSVCGSGTEVGNDLCVGCAVGLEAMVCGGCLNLGSS